MHDVADPHPAVDEHDVERVTHPEGVNLTSRLEEQRVSFGEALEAEQSQ